MSTERRRKDERRAEQLRQVARRIKDGSSRGTRKSPVTRIADVKRRHRRQRP